MSDERYKGVMLQDDGHPKGWFSLPQASIYKREVRKVHNGVVVEVGSWMGRSLSFIVDICVEQNNRLVSIDLWDNKKDFFKKDKQKINVFEAFISFMQAS